MLKVNDGTGNGSGRYEEITGGEDIIAGAGGKKESAEDIGNFLIGWSEWLAEIINMVKDFFEKIKYAIDHKGQ